MRPPTCGALYPQHYSSRLVSDLVICARQDPCLWCLGDFLKTSCVCWGVPLVYHMTHGPHPSVYDQWAANVWVRWLATLKMFYFMAQEKGLSQW